MSIYTLGIWTVKPGREDEFVEAWRDFAERTRDEFRASGATLLRDREVPNRFISSGPWDSMEAVESWRASSLFAEGVGRIRELLDGFETHTMDLAAEVG
jgi:heme-degrading monooxygenase HmoA